MKPEKKWLSLYIVFCIGSLLFADNSPVVVSGDVGGSYQSAKSRQGHMITGRTSLGIMGRGQNQTINIQSGHPAFAQFRLALRDDKIQNESLEDNSNGLTSTGNIKSFALYRNFPNPFNLSTTIQYDLPEESQVIVKIYEVTGHEVCTLVKEVQSAGRKIISWQGENQQGVLVGSGVYVVHILAGQHKSSMKILLIK